MACSQNCHGMKRIIDLWDFIWLISCGHCANISMVPSYLFPDSLAPLLFPPHLISDVPCTIMQYLSSPSLLLFLSLHAATAGVDQTSLSKMAMIIQTSCLCGATSPLIPASHPFVHPFQHSLLNVTLLPQYSHMGSGFALFIPSKLHIYNAGSMKTCAILWCHPPNSEKLWALKHCLIEI